MTNVIAAIKTVTITPHIVVRQAEEAAEFYVKALGAEIVCLIKTPTGQVMHGAISIDGAQVYLVEEFPDFGAKSPQLLGGSPVSMHVQCPDVDARFQRAVDAGCTVAMPVSDQFWGDRFGVVTDPYGHSWSFATTVREVSGEEIAQAVANLDGSECGAHS